MEKSKTMCEAQKIQLKQDRKYTDIIKLWPVHVTIVAAEKQSGIQHAVRHIVIFGLSGTTIFFHTIS
jgi:hypothetical protein